MNQPDNEPKQQNPWNPSVSPGLGAAMPGYESNPFKVFLNGLKQLFTLNLTTLLKLFGAAILPAVVVAVLVVAAFSSGFSFEGLGQNHPGVIIVVLLIVTAIIGLMVWWMIVATAYQWYGVMTSRGEKAGFRQAMRVGIKKWLGLFLLDLLRSLIILAGLIAFIVPGIIFAYWYSLATFIYVDSELGPIEALKRSRELVKGKAAEIFGLVGVTVLVNIPTVLPLIGIIYSFFSSPLTKLAFGYRYNSARVLEGAGQAKPPTSPTNYVAIFLIPVFIVLFIIASIALDDQSSSNEILGYLTSRG